jgi:hypothetical protein
VLEYIHNKKWVGSLLSAFHCRSYYKYTPELIALFKNPEYVRYRWDIGNALLLCRHKKFVPQYLEIVNSEEYGEEPDLIMEILCLLKAKEALPRLLELYEKYPDVEFLMINATDGYQETIETAKKYYEDEGYDFNIYFDTNIEAVNNYGLTGFPATFFIDEEGYLQASAGGMIDYETLEKGIGLIRNS